MYINYINDRKNLGYESLVDIECGNRLVESEEEIFFFLLFILILVAVLDAVFGDNERFFEKEDLYV